MPQNAWLGRRKLSAASVVPDATAVGVGVAVRVGVAVGDGEAAGTSARNDVIFAVTALARTRRPAKPEARLVSLTVIVQVVGSALPPAQTRAVRVEPTIRNRSV